MARPGAVGTVGGMDLSLLWTYNTPGLVWLLAALAVLATALLLLSPRCRAAESRFLVWALFCLLLVLPEVW